MTLSPLRRTWLVASRDAPRRLIRPIAVLLLASLLAACESALNLAGTEAASRQALRRSDLFQAAAHTGKAVVVVGNHGLMLRSTDGGSSWQRQNFAGWPSLVDVTACGNGLFAALAVEGEVWISDDDGLTWSARPLETEEAPQAITCDPNDRLWVVGSFGTILASADGGDSWSDHSPGDDIIFNHIRFFDARTALVLGEFGAVMWSRDGGATWTVADQPMPEEFYPLAAWFRSPQEGWVAGISGQILYTGDGGSTWTLQSTGTIVPLYGLVPVGGVLHAVGGEGTVLRLDGERWLHVEHGKPIRLHLRAHLALDEQRLLVGGAAGALHVLSLREPSASTPSSTGS